MGHSIAHVTFTASEAESIRSRDSNSYGGPGTFESKMVGAAVARWHDEESDRWDSANAGHGVLARMLTPETVNNWLTINHNLVAQRSAVVPYCRAEDVKVARTKVQVHVDSDVLTQIQTSLAAGRTAVSPSLYAALQLEEDADVVSVEVIKAPKQRAPKATQTAGSLRTVYSLVDRDRRTWGEFDTIAQARTAGLALMSEHPELSSLSVKAKVLRAEDENLLVIARPVASDAQITIEVTRHTAKAGAKAENYHVAFDYHH